MIRLRAHIAFVLIAVLTFTGHSMAIARGMPTASGYMELCTGTGPVMIAVDQNGEPTGAHHICPEFSLMLMDAVAPVPAQPVPLHESSSQAVATEALETRVIRPVFHPARGPPVVL